MLLIKINLVVVVHIAIFIILFKVSLERESGVINGDLSDDIVFLRQVLKYHWLIISDNIVTING